MITTKNLKWANEGSAGASYAEITFKNGYTVSILHYPLTEGVAPGDEVDSDWEYKLIISKKSENYTIDNLDTTCLQEKEVDAVMGTVQLFNQI